MSINRIAEWLPPSAAADRPASPGLGIYLHRATDTGAVTVWDGAAWRTVSGSGFANPMTTAGDLIKGGVSGSPGRLAIGTEGQLLTVVGGAFSWVTPTGGGIASRRLAADVDTRLLWECDGASGDLVNTGTLGAAGDLTPGGACVRNALNVRSTIGRGILTNGGATGGATGATDIAITGTALTACVTFVVASWPGGSVPVLARNAGPGWGPPYLGFRISLSSGGVIQAELELAAGAHPSPYAGGYGAGMHQAVAVYDGANFKLYVDGELASSSAATAAMAMDAGGAGGTWNLATQGDGGGSTATILRAQVLAASWSADRVAEEWLRTVGNL